MFCMGWWGFLLAHSPRRLNFTLSKSSSVFTLLLSRLVSEPRAYSNFPLVANPCEISPGLWLSVNDTRACPVLTWSRLCPWVLRHLLEIRASSFFSVSFQLWIIFSLFLFFLKFELSCIFIENEWKQPVRLSMGSGVWIKNPLWSGNLLIDVNPATVAWAGSLYFLLINSEYKTGPLLLYSRREWLYRIITL